MIRWLIDTNVWIDAYAGRDYARRLISFARQSPEAWIAYSSISRLEVLGYADLSSVDASNLKTILDQFTELEVSKEVIELAIQLRCMTRIKTPDALIAATARCYHADLVTRNIQDFNRIPGLVILNPETFNPA